ncbi:SAG family member [Eimeria brunetti]|uniref:SAG family member n=1 Tax=Eimeria brunetti TaxID=51314 RepID=U6L5F7_9EIME|nr:SAG family member [Eimeria brunetti]
MASFYRTTAAVCLVALYVLRSEAKDQTTYKFKAFNVDDTCYLAANLARNGSLPVHINEVARGESLVSTLKTKVESQENVIEEAAVSDHSCDALVKKEGLKDIFHYTFPQQENPNYRELLQAALDAGLAVFTDTKHQNNWQQIWAVDAGASLAYLLGANSTTIGCVIGQCTAATSVVGGGRSAATPTGKAVLFCELNPAAQKDQAPFDEEYYDGLIARTAKLVSMTEEDLKAASNDATAATAIPTILSAGVIAMLTVVSA